LGLYTGTTIMLYLLLIALFIPLLMVILLATAAIGAAAVIHPIFVLPISIGFLALLAYFLVPLALIYIVRTVENRSFFDGLSRAYELSKYYRWQTLGIYIIAFCLTLSLTFLPSLVSTGILSGLVWFSVESPTLLLTILQLVLNIIAALGNIVLFLSVAFQYYNLVERFEGVGLLKKIAQIGTLDETSLDHRVY